jgi:predicted O-methyltransferase YrrM
LILTDAVTRYLETLRSEPDPVLAEMEAQAAREGIPIVVPETGRLLEVLALARGARRIVEVGTAIGVSTLYMGRALPLGGQIVSFEIDERRHADAVSYLERAGLANRVDLRLADARTGLGGLQPGFDMAFIDGVKAQYGDYLELLLPLLGPGAVLAVDNVLMDGAVAEGRGDGNWTDDHVAVAREFNTRLSTDERLAGTLLPSGDGVFVAVVR